jgi:hypothetical protein
MRRRRIILTLLILAAAGGVLWAAMTAREVTVRGPGAELPDVDEARLEAMGVALLEPILVDAGAGHVGPWRMNRSDWRYVDDPTVALDPTGGALVAWVDQARRDVLFRRYDPDGDPLWETPVDVSRSPEVFSWLPSLALDPGDPDRVYVFWQEIVFSGGTHGGEAFFARSTDGGRTFEAPVNLSNTTAGVGKGRSGPERWHNGSLALSAGPEGTVHAAWTAYQGPLWTARSTDGGASFSEPLRITEEGDGVPARAPSIAVAPDGGVHLAWAVGDDPAADLRYAISESGGRTFTPPRALFPDEAHADAPKLAVDEAGTVHLAWHESPAGVVGGHRILYARAPVGEEGFEAPRAVSGDLGEEVGSVRYPSLALDGDGSPHLTFELHADGGDRSRGLGLTLSRDGGETFEPPTVVPGTADPGFRLNGSLQGLLMDKLAVSGSGRIAVVNSSFEPGEGSRVVLVHGRTGGG